MHKNWTQLTRKSWFVEKYVKELSALSHSKQNIPVKKMIIYENVMLRTRFVGSVHIQVIASHSLTHMKDAFSRMMLSFFSHMEYQTCHYMSSRKNYLIIKSLSSKDGTLGTGSSN